MSDSVEITVRLGCEDDLDSVTELWIELMDLHHSMTPDNWRRAPDGHLKFREWMATAVEAEDRALFAAEADDCVVGFAHVTLNDSPPPVVPRKSGFLSDLAVAEDVRGKGAGRKLLCSAEGWCREHGCTELTLSTAVQNEGAIGFYRAMGFEPVTCKMHKPLP
jgi:GNAT superfamily N-acetyltransferase